MSARGGVCARMQHQAHPLGVQGRARQKPKETRGDNHRQATGIHAQTLWVCGEGQKERKKGRKGKKKEEEKENKAPYLRVPDDVEECDDVGPVLEVLQDFDLSLDLLLLDRLQDLDHL